ncbi:A1 cistron-splicing factor [Dipodascopsis uninucleata]
MMQLPPKTTIILDNIPDNCLLGIDFQFFTPTADFRGIKSIPDGIHVLHWSTLLRANEREHLTSTSTGFMLQEENQNRIIEINGDNDEVIDESAMNGRLRLAKNGTSLEPALGSINMRMAHFIDAHEGSVLRFRWQDEEESFVEKPTNLPMKALEELYGHLLRYPENSFPVFSEIASEITVERLSQLLPVSYNKLKTPISSTSASDIDTYLLDEAIAKASGTKMQESEDEESFRFLKYDLKRQRTWREGAVGRELTAAALDRSWFLSDIVRRQRDGDYNMVLAEVQQCFILIVILANYSAAEQWKRLLELLCTCKTAIYTMPDFYIKLLQILALQFESIPDVYFENLLGPLFVKKQIRELKKTINDPSNRSFTTTNENEQNITSFTESKRVEMLSLLSEISSVLREKFGVDISNSDSRRNKLNMASEVETAQQYGSEDVNYEPDIGNESDDADEETGEYAPVIVNL